MWILVKWAPVIDTLKEQGHDAEAAGNLFGAIDALRIPVEYLAELFSAGDAQVVTDVLQKLAAMRSYMRGVTMKGERDAELAAAVGLTPEAMEQMYRLLAIAKYDERYVIRRRTPKRRTTWRRWAAASTSTAARAWATREVRVRLARSGSGGDRDVPVDQGPPGGRCGRCAADAADALG